MVLLSLALAAPEICDGIDNDGDGQSDEGPVVVFADLDQDGFGDPASMFVLSDCSTIGGAAAAGTDCDDQLSTRNPGALEVCDGTDNDCDGEIDEEGCANCTRFTNGNSTYQQCLDKESWNTARDNCLAMGQDLAVIETAQENDFLIGSMPTLEQYAWIGLVDENFDNEFFWVDGSPVTYENWVSGSPNDVTEGCGYLRHLTGNWAEWNCAADDDDTISYCEVECVERVWYTDADGDGFGGPNQTMSCIAPDQGVANGLDCNDADPDVNPTATEVCDGHDNDCDQAFDEGVLIEFYADHDGDTFGDASLPVFACSQPPFSAIDPGDCDDTDPTVYPGAVELCNGEDDDCDGEHDEHIESVQFYIDDDHDGFGFLPGVFDCQAPAGQTPLDGDCDDTDAAIHPNAVELCSNAGVDNDCDPDTTSVDALTFYEDADTDGYGDPATPIVACEQGSAASNAEDCNDADPAIHPFAQEFCDGLDNDCDLLIDNDPVNTTTWFLDLDHDGQGNPDEATEACFQPAGTVDNDLDCNDGDASTFLGALELCDEIDNDCDLVIDNDVVFQQFYQDEDLDGWGNEPGDFNCAPPDGQTSLSGDCDDQDFWVNPGAEELCADQGVDNDCDPGDETPIDGAELYDDLDGDGFGAPGTAVLYCVPFPTGVVDNAEDCDDSQATVHEGREEVCDGLDNDCDGHVDEGVPPVTYFPDLDGDGFGAIEGILLCEEPLFDYQLDGADCDDQNADIFPGAVEIPDNSIDEDCDGEDEIGEDTDDTDIPATDVPDDTDTPDDTQPPPLVTRLACSCSQTQTPWLGLLLAPLTLFRRRREPGARETTPLHRSSCGGVSCD